MADEISLDKLFAEQQKSADPLFVVLPLNDEFARIQPWNPGRGCMCGGFVKVPRSAIRSVKKIGRSHHCCGKTLQVVTVEFSEEPTLTYANLFDELRHATKAVRTPQFRFRRKPHRRPIIVPIYQPVWPGGFDTGWNPTGGGNGDPDEQAWQAFQDCVTACIIDAYLTETQGNVKPMSTQQVQQFIENVRGLCELACLNNPPAGQPDSGDDQ